MQTNQKTLSVEDLIRIRNQQHAANGVKTEKPLTGAAAEYKKYVNTSTFKLIVYFNQDKQGRYFTLPEKNANKNRRYIPSIDFVMGTGGHMVQNHEAGFVKLIDYVMQNIATIDKAMIVYNDYKAGFEKLIVNFNTKRLDHSLYVNPVFKDYNGSRLLDYIDGDPLRTDEIRYYAKY